MFCMTELQAMYAVGAKLAKQYIPTVRESKVEMPLTGISLPFQDDAVLMEYTGLRDKNGAEIWEGDIVKISIPPLIGDIIAIVKFNDGCFDVESISISTQGKDYLKCYTVNHAVEKLGNIFDNPDLLGKGGDAE